MSKTEIPSIRFRGFDDAWEQRKAKELFVSTADKGYPELPVLSATQDRGMIRRDENSINIFHDKKNEAGYKRVLPGQFVIHLRSFQGGFAHSAIEGITSPAYTVFGFSEPEKHDSEYWKYVFTSKSFIQRLETVTYGIRDGRSISYEEFLTLGFVYPSKAEQTAIARYLDKLSDLITLHQRKFEKLTNVKKSMLEKMFPQNGSSYPEIRFKGFTDPWEQRKLGEVATFINGRAYSQPELLSSGKYKVLRVGNFYTNDSWYYSDLELGEKYYADYGDLLYTWSATFGPHIWLGDRVIYHYHIWKIDLSNQLEKQFAVQLLEQDKANILSSKNGSTMVHITKEGMEQKDVIIPPSTKEQQEIGAFFLQLDNLITLHQRELEKLQSIKKALLEKMFV